MAAIGHIVAGVHHVGSTSIPGMPAKQMLDIAVLLHDFDDGERCITPLENIGYVHMGVMDDIPGDRIFGKCDDPQVGYPDFDEKDETAGRRGPKVGTHILHMYTLNSSVLVEPVRWVHERSHLPSPANTMRVGADARLRPFPVKGSRRPESRGLGGTPHTRWAT